MGRKRKFFLTTIMSLVNQGVTVAYGFVLPVYILQSYGSAVNGLISSITHFLGFISFMEMGIGQVIQSNLYKPLEDHDFKSVSRIYLASEHFFRIIASLFLAYTFILVCVYPKFINNSFDSLYTGSLLLILSISTLAQYYLGISLQILLAADQRTYVICAVNAFTLALNTIAGVLLIKYGASIHIVKLLSAITFVLRPILLLLYVRKHYVIDRTITYKSDPIRQKWSGISYHLSGIIVANAGAILLTFFSTLENVSVYAIYSLIAGGFGKIFQSLMNGVPSLFGNIIARKEWDILQDVHAMMEWMIHMMLTCFFSVAALLIVPFVMVYTRGITDTDYNVPLFALIFVAAEGMHCLREYFVSMITAAGHYKQTQNGAWLQAAIYLMVSIPLVGFYGLIGVAIGLFVAMAFHVLYFVWYMRDNILHRPMYHFWRNIAIDFITVFSIYWIVPSIECSLNVSSYVGWMMQAMKICMASVIITLVIQYIFNHAFIKDFNKLFMPK